MKHFRQWLGFLVAAFTMILSGGGAYAMADDPAIQDPIGNIDGPGSGVGGANTRTQSQAHMEDDVHDYNYYVKQINRRICEMKLESCPIDQILRSASRTNQSTDMVVHYYQIGQ